MSPNMQTAPSWLAAHPHCRASSLQRYPPVLGLALPRTSALQQFHHQNPISAPVLSHYGLLANGRVFGVPHHGHGMPSHNLDSLPMRRRNPGWLHMVASLSRAAPRALPVSMLMDHLPEALLYTSQLRLSHRHCLKPLLLLPSRQRRLPTPLEKGRPAPPLAGVGNSLSPPAAAPSRLPQSNHHRQRHPERKSPCEIAAAEAAFPHELGRPTSAAPWLWPKPRRCDVGRPGPARGCPEPRPALVAEAGSELVH
mmetsp:Transcript_145699/g.252986  ORF Transcript_145699/g.252986 Transcript_145699/m.252986 type:complete len:253 (-) Transcript_145699:512-1270(-)